ncbi:uncharacterized protein EI90DRAFT_148739 [Cantharellus anzutake]|uniref:uncharacterized protein n=1 Tax=Cantharellus anzutake TaxID=1750568 RepID=UPI001903800F|nr:uncharacterized protein EI90DRAFT_148739 [Cantharellus anzutake]KAF8317507.1 hypothetical protein EI90DRAFT_148739 [Cantharellus anzutake]
MRLTTCSSTWTPLNSFQSNPMSCRKSLTTSLHKTFLRSSCCPLLELKCRVNCFSPVLASGEFSSRTIPLSDEALSARGLMEAKLSPLPEMGVWDNEWVNYEAELRELDVRNGVVTCAALSRDGHHIALAFGSGIVEIADIDQQRTVTRFECDPPRLLIWVEFVHDNHRIATEDSEGNITIFSRDIRAMRLSTLPSGRYPPVTAVSDNGLLIARIQQDLGRNWYDYMSLLYVSDDLSVQPLASPPSDTSTPSSQPDSKLAIPHRRTIGFSPGARYVAAFDGISACVWSTESREFIARYHVTALEYWILNPGTAPLCPYSISDPMSTGPALPLRDDTVDVETDSGLNADESWIKRPFYDLLPSMREVMHNDVRSFATGRTPLLQSVGMTSGIWFNGERELVVPGNYQPIQNNAKSRVSWYGDRVPDDLTYSYRPSSSRDGTRFLLQGRTKAPIVVDISEVV